MEDDELWSGRRSCESRVAPASRHEPGWSGSLVLAPHQDLVRLGDLEMVLRTPAFNVRRCQSQQITETCRMVVTSQVLCTSYVAFPSKGSHLETTLSDLCCHLVCSQALPWVLQCCAELCALGHPVGCHLHPQVRSHSGCLGPALITALP